MYNEIAVINKVECKKTRSELLLVFLVEYSGWLQHLHSVGGKWGAAGEEVGAAKEAIKCKNHIEVLKSKIMELSYGSLT